MDLVSVIIPIYNVEKYLCECIDSVLAQTYSELEVILVDDGSPDRCGKICDEYKEKDARVKVIHKENGGLSDARNAGLEEARGTYIYFLDSDDYIIENCIQTLVNFMEQNQLDVIHFDALTFSDEGEISDSRKSYYQTKYLYSDIYTGPEAYDQLIRFNEYRSPVQYFLFKADFIKKNVPLFHKGILHEDEEYTLFVFLAAKRVMYIPLTLYYHRVRSNSIMGCGISLRNLDSCLEILKAFIERKDDYLLRESEVQEFFYKCILRVCDVYLSKYRMLGNKDSEKVQENFESFKKILRDVDYLGNNVIKNKVHPNLIRYLGRKIKAILVSNQILCNQVDRSILKKRVYDSDTKSCLEQMRRTRNEKNRIIVLCVHHNHGNRGDLAITLAQKELLKTRYPNRRIIEIPTDLCEYYGDTVSNLIQSEDTLVISGGGWFGSFWRHNEEAAKNIIVNHPNNRIVVFPQTIYYSDDENGRKELICDREFFKRFTQLHVCVRDKQSFNMIKKVKLFSNNVNIILLPDVVLTYCYHANPHNRSNHALVCFRTDIEADLSFYQKSDVIIRAGKMCDKLIFTSTNRPDKPVKISERKEVVNGFLDELSQCKFVVTDRLHCMIMAAISGTPCVAINNRTGKVMGVYEWIKNTSYIQIVEDLSELEEKIHLTIANMYEWDNTEILSKYEQLYEIIDV